MANKNQEKVQEYNEQEQKIWRVGTLTYTLWGLAIVFAILLGGDLIWSLRDRSVGPVLQILFVKHQASDFFNSVMMVTLPGVLGLGIAPVISFLSDRHRGRFGRRIPFLFITTPIVVAGILGIGLSSFAATFLHKFFPSWSYDNLMLAMLGLSWLFFEVGAIAGNFIFGALIKDVVPEAFLGRFYGLFRIVSLAAGIVFNFYLIGIAKEHYIFIFILLGTVYGIAFTMICAFIKEGSYPPPPALPPGESGPFGATKTYIRESFKSPYYWLVFAILTMMWVVFMPVNTFMMFYVEALDKAGMMADSVSLERALAFIGIREGSGLFDALGVHANGVTFYGKCTALSFVLSLVLAYPLGALVDRFHPLRCTMIVLAIAIVSYLLTAPFIHSKLTFAIALIVHNVVSGTAATVGASLPLRLFPMARFAQFNSAASLVASVFMMCTIPLIGKFLDMTGRHYYLTFYIGAGFAALALITCIAYYPSFKKRGGPNNYIAPEL